MEALKRRGFLQLLAATGAAAVCGMKAGEALAQPPAGEAAKAAAGAEAVTETAEVALEPDQFYFVRRRRWRRRRVFYFRPRRRVRYFYRRPRRVYFVRRRPRYVRFYRVRRVRRFRRW